MTSILQEGCVCLSLLSNGNAIPVLDLQLDEKISGSKYTITIPMAELLESCDNLIPGMACIVEHSNSVLPCRILQIDVNKITIEFTARPQIMKRLVKAI